MLLNRGVVSDDNDDKHETSQNCANYPHSRSDVVTRHESLRRCKSDSELRGRTQVKINRRMGIRVSRWKSADTLITDSEDFVYRPLSKVNVLVNKCEEEEGVVDDYELLESSSATEQDDDDDDDNDDEKLNIIVERRDNGGDHQSDKSNGNNLSENLIIKTTVVACDGRHDNTENSRTELSIKKLTNTPLFNENKVTTAAMKNDCVITKFSTLPRAKSRENVALSEISFRKSCKLSGNSSVKNNVQEMTELVRRNDTSAAAVEKPKSDKSQFECTTLPKIARSRFSEPHFRQSLRHAIDLSVDGTSRKHLSECSGSNASGNNATPSALPNSESTSGTEVSKLKRSRSNLSWSNLMRKSMKKLKSFQMPQQQHQHPPEQIESALSTPILSPNQMPSSLDLNPIHNIECEKENLPHVVNMEVAPENPDIFNAILQQQQQQEINESRPRQYGRRRSNPIRISSSMNVHEPLNHATARIIAHHQDRPNSAPVTAVPISPTTATTISSTRTTSQSTNLQRNSAHRPRQSLPSEASSIASSRNSSPVSMVSSTGSSSLPDAAIDSEIRPRFNSNNLTAADDDERDQNENGGEESKTSSWPHLLSRPICCVFCTLGLFNISRFAIFSVHFGANFLVQFLLLSFVFGIPFVWLQMVLGDKIKGGIVTMYRISPICKGIGISLMISHCIISLYSSVSIAWVLIYLRDSMISSDEHYSWEERFDSYRGYQNISQLRLSENIADYFNGVVLQRLSGLVSTHDGKMRFQLAFNVSIVWILIFIILCRGIRSIGKVAIVLCLFSFLCLAAVCIKFLTLLNFETVQDIFPATDWQEFFANSHSWSVAVQEVFLTWGLCGVSIYSIYCKSDKNQRLNHFILRREALLIVFLTLFGLFLGGVLGSTCVIILKLNGFNYFPASFENPKNDIFLWPMHFASLPSFHHSIPSKWIPRYSNVIGESFERPIFVNQQGIQVYKESGFKPIRLVTEILPSTLAISSRIEPIWGTLAFLCLFLFGLGQLAVMWKPISGAIGNSTSAILLSCVTGLFLGVPLTTDNGIVIMHFFDYVFGGSWFIPVLWSCYLLSIFMVRGTPFSSDILVKELRLTETFSAFLAFSWNVLMPVGMLLLSVMEYKKSHSTELFHQRNIVSLSHLSNWPLWVKQVGGFLQVSLLIFLPCVALVQIYIYLSRGPRDILERIERLFRPPMDSGIDSMSHIPIRRLCQTNLNQPQPLAISNNEANSINLANDAPPKYSPPPSYSRAMGLRVAAKIIRNSIRRSVRRFRRAELPQTEAQNIPTISSSVNAETPAFAQNINEFIRASFRRNTTSSTEQLVLSEISLGNNNESNQIV